MVEKKKILVVAAHPDDEVLGCGGIMAKFAMEGDEVYSVILSEGITARDKSRDASKRAAEVDELKQHINNAHGVLGVKKSFTFDLPDNRFDSVDLLDIVKMVEGVKREVKPDIIFTHHWGDLNVDHRYTFDAVMIASRPMKDEPTCAIYSFEVLSSTEWNNPSASTYFMPNYFVNIEKTTTKKVDAMKQYKTEIRDFPHPRSPEAIEILAKQRGIQVGLFAAEAFEVVRLIER